MDELTIETTAGQRSFRPGESVTGLVQWRLQRAPKAIELRLFWRTSGRGTPDVGYSSRITFEQPTAHESRPFLFIAPAAPVSFSGRLISLIWALELIATPAAECARLDLVISPTGAELEPKSPSRP